MTQEPIYPVKQYIGARYVPIFGRKNENTIEWDNSKPYEPLSVVTYQGNSYTSKQYVPSNIEITDETYWAQTGNYNAQIESYRREVKECQDTNQELKKSIGILNVRTNRSYVIFGDEWALKMYDTFKQIFAKSETHIFAENGANFKDTLISQVDTALADETVKPTNITDIIVICGVNDYNKNTSAYNVSSSFMYITNKFPYSTIHYYPSIANNGGGQSNNIYTHKYFITGATENGNVNVNVTAFNYLISIIKTFDTTTTLTASGYEAYARYVSNTLHGGQYRLSPFDYPYKQQSECVPVLGHAQSYDFSDYANNTAAVFDRTYMQFVNHTDGTIDLNYHLRAHVKNLTTETTGSYWKILLPYQMYKNNGLNTLPIRTDLSSSTNKNNWMNNGVLTYVDASNNTQEINLQRTNLRYEWYPHSDGVQQVKDFTIAIDLNKTGIDNTIKSLTAEVWGTIPFYIA
jgi:hypothetical protein